MPPAVNELIEREDRWILPLRGSRVTHIEWGDDVTFELDPPGRITVGSAALLTHGSLRAPEADPKMLRQCGHDQARQATDAPIVSAVGFKNGALRIVFDTGWHLNIKATGPFVPASVTSDDTIIWTHTPTD